MQDIYKALKLRHFRLIDAIARLGQLSLAADECAVTQPAASRSLAEVERAIGAPLFERHAKGMRLTPVGDVMARHAKGLLAGFDQAKDELLSFSAGRSGTVRLGAVTGAALGFVVPAIQQVKAQSAGADISVEVAPSTDLLARLLSGDLDFVLCRVPPGLDVSRLAVLRGRVEHLDLLVGPENPLRSRQDLHLGDLSEHTWIMQARGMPIREGIEQAHMNQGLASPADVIQTSSILMTIAYLRTPNAVSPVAKEVSDLLTSSGPEGLSALRMRSGITLSPYHLIRHKDRQLSPIAQQMLDTVYRVLSA